MPYRVKLNNFEGPLDLLLFLIKKNEVDIYDIPIAKITAQFLRYLEIIQMMDLEGAGDFILMAAILIRIKAKMLLPRTDEEEDDEEDPRLELVQRLIEYKRFKDLTPVLYEKESVQSNYYPRSNFSFDFEEEGPDVGELLNDVSLFQLMEVFQKVLEKAPKPVFHRVELLSVTLDEQIDYVLEILKERSTILFADLMMQLENRIKIIVTFIAVLELVKRNQLLIKQRVPFGDIWIQKK